MIQETGPTTRSNKNKNNNNNKKLGLHEEDRAPRRRSGSTKKIALRQENRAPGRRSRSAKKFGLREEKRGGYTKKRTPAWMCTCHHAVFTLGLRSCTEVHALKYRSAWRSFLDGRRQDQAYDARRWCPDWHRQRIDSMIQEWFA
jgi:hypothetical protein